MRAFLAAVFLFGQTVFSLHHHEHSGAAALRPSACSVVSNADHSSLSTGDDCLLCAAQAQPRAVALVPVAIVALSVPACAVASASSDAPRRRRFVRVSDRSPPVA